MPLGLRHFHFLLLAAGNRTVSAMPLDDFTRDVPRDEPPNHQEAGEGPESGLGGTDR